MAMKDKKIVMEAARAAGLAAHSAAGLATASSLREAARLLRTAEALTRTAVAVLSYSATSMTSSTSPGCGPSDLKVISPRSSSPIVARECQSDTNVRKRRRGRSNKKLQHQVDSLQSREGGNAPAKPFDAMDVDDEVSANGKPSGGSASCVSPGRVLTRHETLPQYP